VESSCNWFKAESEFTTHITFPSTKTWAIFVGCAVFTAVFMKIYFWDLLSCKPLKVNGCFGETFQFHVQGRKINEVRHSNAHHTVRILESVYRRGLDW
jgi:hypothetical protein